MHDLRLIHTDLKPKNILLVSSEYIKVPDYKCSLLSGYMIWVMSLSYFLMGLGLFKALMSLGPSRLGFDFCFYRASAVEHLDGHIGIIHMQLTNHWLPWFPWQFLCHWKCKESTAISRILQPQFVIGK